MRYPCHCTKLSFQFIAVLIVIFCILPAGRAEEPNQPGPELGIDEKLGEFIPMDTEFFDENGEKITIREAAGGKPFILSLVYFECPSICTPLLTDLGKVMDQIALAPGKDFRIITISFNPDEGYRLAKSKKRNYFTALERDIPDNAWRFLTGTQKNIKAVTDAVGFLYKKVAEGYVHSGAIMAISPEGKISRYLLGITFLPFDVKMSLVEASEGKTGPTINKFLQFCFNYDPQGRRYVFNILAIVGVVSILVVGGVLTFLLTTSKKHRPKSERGE